MIKSTSKNLKGKSLKKNSNEPTLINLSDIVEGKNISISKIKAPKAKNSKRKPITSIPSLSNKTSITPNGTSKVPKKKSSKDTSNGTTTSVITTVGISASEAPSAVPTESETTSPSHRVPDKSKIPSIAPTKIQSNLPSNKAFVRTSEAPSSSHSFENSNITKDLKPTDTAAENTAANVSREPTTVPSIGPSLSYNQASSVIDNSIILPPCESIVDDTGNIGVQSRCIVMTDKVMSEINTHELRVNFEYEFTYVKGSGVSQLLNAIENQIHQIIVEKSLDCSNWYLRQKNNSKVRNSNTSRYNSSNIEGMPIGVSSLPIDSFNNGKECSVMDITSDGYCSRVHGTYTVLFEKEVKKIPMFEAMNEQLKTLDYAERSGKFKNVHPNITGFVYLGQILTSDEIVNPNPNGNNGTIFEHINRSTNLEPGFVSIQRVILPIVASIGLCLAFVAALLFKFAYKKTYQIDVTPKGPENQLKVNIFDFRSDLFNLSDSSDHDECDNASLSSCTITYDNACV